MATKELMFGCDSISTAVSVSWNDDEAGYTVYIQGPLVIDDAGELVMSEAPSLTFDTLAEALREAADAMESIGGEDWYGYESDLEDDDED